VEEEMRVETANFGRRAARFVTGAVFALAFCLSAAGALAQTGGGAAGENPQPAAAAKGGGDRLASLRAQIAEAKTDADRWRLQRTLVDYFVALGKEREAVAELRAMARTEKLDPVYFYNTGNALARLGATEDAVEAYRKAIEQRHGNYARALNNLGVLLLRQGEWDKAQESFANALRLENSRYGEASFNLGRVYAARGEADQAIREWNRTLSVAPDHADAAAALARAYAEDGSPERGISVLERFAARNGASDELAQVRREILAEDSPAAGAGPAAEVSAPGHAGDEKPTREAAVAKPAAAKPAAAKAATSLRTLSVDRETYDFMLRARAAREKGDNEEAVKLYRRVLTRSGGVFPPANLELAFALGSLRRHEEAAAALAQVASREGARYPIAYYHLGRQYEQLGQFDQAARAYEQAAAAYGDANPQFLLDLSRARDKGGDAAGAVEAMEAYISVTRSQGRLPEWSQSRLAELREKAGQK
jgi:tetratricopeptide (TPR) repeat protein